MSTPTTPAGQATSYKTNVNRAKTKRWVEAKSYSYDGDDWGDVDDYDEYGGYDEPEPSPKPTGLRQRGQSASQGSQSAYGHNAPQGIASHGTPSNSQYASAPPLQQSSARNMTTPAMEHQIRSQNVDSFDQEGGRRTFSAGPHPPTQSSQNISAQDFQPGMNQGYPNQPSQPPPTHHVSSFSIQPGFDSQARHGPQPSTTSDNYRSHQLGDQMHVLSHDSRIQSASNYSSAPGLMDRRDFSPSAMPPPLQTRNSPSPHSNPQGRPPRKSSLSQQSQPALPFDPRAPPSAPFSNALDGQARSRAGSSASGGKSSVLIRPADIYKRMEEERERERQSQESSRPSMDAITGKPAERSSLDTKLESDSAQRLKPKLDAVTERKSEYGFEGLKSDMQPKGNDRKTPEDLAKHNDKKRTTSKTFNLPKSSQPSAAQESTLSPGLTLPDPTRISGWGQGFGESFLGPRDTHGQLSKDMTLSPVLSDPSEKPTGRDQHISEPDLRHQQSKGFRSAVHQAFDTAQEQVPPTPSSNADSSIGRSTSGGTSTVSPIMSRGPSAVDRDRTHELPSIEDVTTPTQEEDNLRLKTRQRASGSVGTLTQASQNLESQNEDDIEPPPPGFIMGHRRESGTPSPDNSPARLPILASMSHLRHPHEADLAQATPTPTDSVPSASNSLRVSETSEVSEASAAKGFRSADVQSTSSSDQVASDPTTEMAVPHNLPYSLNRTNSSGSGRVKNLVENFESSTRPDSPQSITTPRASLLGQNPVAPNVRGNGRPANERMESFRPQLPGGWESSASIMPSQGYSYQDSVLSHDANKEAPAELPATRKMSLSRNDEQSELAQTGDMSSRVHRAAAGAEKTSAAAMLPPPLRSELSGADQSASKSSKAPTSLPKDTARQEPFTSDSVEPTSQRDASSASTMSPSPAKQPPSLPSLSTDVGTEQYESDRLRREIVRELRSEPSTAESASSYQASSRYPTNESVARYPTNDSMMSNDHGSGHVPSEYDKYWNDDEEDTTSVASRDPSLAHRAAVAQKEGTSPLAETSPKPDEQHHGAPQEFLVAPQTGEDSRPLKRRFSWEAELADLSPSQAKQKVMPQEATLRDTAPASNSSKPQITTERNPMQSQSVAPPSPDGFVANQMQHTIRDDESLPDSPELEIPTAGASQSLADDMPPPLKDRTSSLEGPEAIVSQPVDHTIWTESAVHDSSELRNRNSSDRVLGEIRPSAPHISTTERMQALPTPPPPSSEVPKLPAFREIMALKTPQERILAFDETQRKFANLNTGLAHWIATTSNALPEHSDLVQTGGQMGVAAPDHKASPSRSKTGQPYYQQYLDASPQSQAGVNAPAGSAPGPNQSQGFSPSGNKITSQQVQAKSKEFLHTAGVFGGKANIAAKGLFSKGKNKLRDASGSKKASPSNLPTTPTSAPRGMQPQHATSQARGDVTASSVDTSGASVQANEAASEHDAPSVQSITQSQLADDERSEEEKADRLPRSSKIYRKRDSSSHKESRRKSNSHELPAAGHMASADNDSQNLAHEASSPSEMQRNTPTQATFGHRRSAGSPKGMAISPVIPTENSEAAVGPNEAQSKHESRLSSSSAYMALQSRYFTRSPNRAASQDSVTSRNPPNGESNGASSFQRQVPDPVGHSKIVNEVDAQLSIQPTQSGSANESVTPGARRPNSIHQAVEQPTSAESRLNLPKSSNTLDVPRHPNAATGDRDAPRSPSRDVSGGRPSMESLPSQIDPDRPPSPMSPQLPIQMTGSPRGRPVVPAHHGIEHNFGPQPSHEETERRSRSFSRPFNSSLERKRSGASDLQQYPPSMQRQLSTEDMVMPDGFYPRPISREQAMVPRSQTSEYAIEGVGPPDVPPKDSKPRSRRGSRSSTFLKSLAKSFTDSDSPSFQNSTADQGHHSPATSGADATPKSKRSSIWGLRKSQLDLSNESTKKSPPTTVPRSELSRTSTNITQLPAPTPPPKKSLEALDDEFPMRPKQRVTTSFSKRLQRIPTSETKEINKEAEVGKKNRLSTLGSIFSRSGHKRNNSSKHARHPSEGESSKPSQPMLPSMQENVRYTSAQAAASPSFEPDPSSYQSQQGLVQPPIGGYYAPRTRKASSQQSRPPAHSNTHQQHTQLQQQPTSPGRDLPAYFEAASLRQQSSPRVSPPASRSSRVSTTLLRKASQADQKEASPSGQRRESRSKGSIWGRVSAQAPSKGRSSQSIPSIGGPFKYNSYAATPHESQTGHTLGHNIRHPTSPPPPPPPPKDEWHRAAPRRSSLAANNPTSSNAAATPSNVLGPSPPDDRQRFILPPLQTNVPNVLTHQHIPHEQQGYTLPPLQTEIPTPHLGTIRSGLSSGTPTTVTNTPGMTFEEKRRSRQYEIEVGHMSPSGGPQSPQHKRRSRQLELETGHMSPAKNPGSMSPAEKRRSRQMEIETGHLSPGGGNTSPQATAGLALKQVREDKDSEAEEPIRMNATSFPGQEWRPDTKYAWLGD